MSRLEKIKQNAIEAKSKQGDIKLIELEAYRKPLAVLIYDNKVFFRLGHIASILNVGNIRKSVQKYVEDTDTTFFTFKSKGYRNQPAKFITAQGLMDLLSTRSGKIAHEFRVVFEKNVLPYCSSGTLFAGKFELSGGKLTKDYHLGEPLVIFNDDNGLYFEFSSLVTLTNGSYQTFYSWVRNNTPSHATLRINPSVITSGQRDRLFLKSDAALDLLAGVNIGTNKEFVRDWLINSVIPWHTQPIKPRENIVVSDIDDLQATPDITITINGVNIPIDSSFDMNELGALLAITTK